MRLPVSADQLEAWRPEVVAAAGAELRPRARANQPRWESGGEPVAPVPVGAPARHTRQLVVGLLLGLLLVAGMLFMTFGGGGGPEAGEAVAGSPADGPEVAPGVATAAGAGGLADVLAAAPGFESSAKPLVERFLAARGADEFAPLVRHPEVTLGRIGAGSGGRPAALRQMKFIKSNGRFHHALVVLDDFSQRRICLEETPAGMRVDWEGWVGWSSTSWNEFRTRRPTQPELFRVTVTPVSYYNYDFKDEARWSAWMARLPGSEEFFYAYVARDSLTEQRLLAARREAANEVTLMLAYPAGAQADNLCEITAVIAAGWSEDPALAASPTEPR